MQKEHVKKFVSGGYSVSDVIDYFRGMFRYHCYYSKKKWIRNLIPCYIKEQIDFRIKVMDRECYNSGSCKMCGCMTTALQMANKSCEKPCYPPIVNKRLWYKWTTKTNCVIYSKFEDKNIVWFFNFGEPFYKPAGMKAKGLAIVNKRKEEIYGVDVAETNN